jgi:hypothetical protein
MLVSTVEPVGQARRRLVGRLPVEGHHRRGHARYPDEAGAPPFFADPCHLDEITPAGNRSFESMPHNNLISDYVVSSEFYAP